MYIIYRRLFGQSLRNDRISYLYVGTLSVPSSEILHFLASGVLLCLICYHTSDRYCIGETVLFCIDIINIRMLSIMCACACIKFGCHRPTFQTTLLKFPNKCNTLLKATNLYAEIYSSVGRINSYRAIGYNA